MYVCMYSMLSYSIHMCVYIHTHKKVIILTSQLGCKYTLVTYEHTHLPKKWYLYPSMTS